MSPIGLSMIYVFCLLLCFGLVLGKRGEAEVDREEAAGNGRERWAFLAWRKGGKRRGTATVCLYNNYPRHVCRAIRTKEVSNDFSTIHGAFFEGRKQNKTKKRSNVTRTPRTHPGPGRGRARARGPAWRARGRRKEGSRSFRFVERVGLSMIGLSTCKVNIEFLIHITLMFVRVCQRIEADSSG